MSHAAHAPCPAESRNDLHLHPDSPEIALEAYRTHEDDRK